ncbi:hypothetical protein ACLKA6_012788 [Drosophila palustris]
MDLPGYVANKIGVPVEAFRLLLTLLAGYPIAAIYHKYVVDRQKTLHHFYFALCGLSLCYYNNGTDTYYSLAATGTTFVLVSFLRSSPLLLLAINFVFHMGYLLLGYYFTISNEYDILWIMPHCILTLRMIGLGFDIADGLNKEEELSFLVGPQFPYRRYQSFTNGEYRQYGGYMNAGLKRRWITVFGAVNYYYAHEISNRTSYVKCKFNNEWMQREKIVYCLGLAYFVLKTIFWLNCN